MNAGCNSPPRDALSEHQTTGPLWILIHKKCMIQDIFPATYYPTKRQAAMIPDSDVAHLSKTRPAPRSNPNMENSSRQAGRPDSHHWSVSATRHTRMPGELPNRHSAEPGVDDRMHCIHNLMSLIGSLLLTWRLLKIAPLVHILVHMKNCLTPLITLRRNSSISRLSPNWRPEMPRCAQVSNSADTIPALNLLQHCLVLR